MNITKETISTNSQKIRNKAVSLVTNLHQKSRPEQGYLDTPEAHLYYEVTGCGTPILMLHGNSQSHHVFHSYKRNLQKNYQVILMDSRGHGRSRAISRMHRHFSAPASGSAATASAASGPAPDEQPYFTIHDMACDAAALLDHLGIEKAILFGFSDGANIALEFACCFPERTLAVISASGNALPHGLRLPVRLGTQMTGWALALFKDFLPDGTLRQHLTNRLQLNTLLTDSPNLSAGRLQQIQAPVLILAGTRDLIKTSHTRWMAEQIPDSQLRLIEGGTHKVLFLQEQQCMKYILEFLLNSQQIPLESQKTK